MRYGWKVELASLAALSLAGCANDDRGGGGGKASQEQTVDNAAKNRDNPDAYPQTYENSNPVSREQEHNKNQGVTLRAEPNSGAPVNGQVADERVRNAQTTQLAAAPKVDLNHASVEELAKVPGIGYNTAKAIVNNRPYTDKADLMRSVPNLSKQQYATFERYVTFGAAGVKGNQ
jgi:DNA uptake protein ComE-like DNA-binding protein